MVVISDLSITSAATSSNLWAARAYFSEMVKQGITFGVKLFITEMASDVALDVPNLPQILQEFQQLLAGKGLSPAAQQALKAFQAK
eukprot:g537.t1